MWSNFDMFRFDVRENVYQGNGFGLSRDVCRLDNRNIVDCQLEVHDRMDTSPAVFLAAHKSTYFYGIIQFYTGVQQLRRADGVGRTFILLRGSKVRGATYMRRTHVLAHCAVRWADTCAILVKAQPHALVTGRAYFLDPRHCSAPNFGSHSAALVTFCPNGDPLFSRAN